MLASRRGHARIIRGTMSRARTGQEKHHAALRGARLAKIRRQANLSQTELADVVGITQASVSRIESGVQGMTETVRVRMADALGVSPSELWPFMTIEETNAE